MKYCPKCKTTIKASAKFCGECGSELLALNSETKTKKKSSSKLVMIVSCLVIFLAGFGLVRKIITNGSANKARSQTVKASPKPTPSQAEETWNHAVYVLANGKNVHKHARGFKVKFCGTVLGFEDPLFSGPKLKVYSRGPSGSRAAKATIEFSDGWKDHLESIPPSSSICVEGSLDRVSGDTICFDDGWILDSNLKPVTFPTPRPRDTPKPTRTPRPRKASRSSSGNDYEEREVYRGPAYPKAESKPHREPRRKKSFVEKMEDLEEELEALKDCPFCKGKGWNDCIYCVDGQIKNFLTGEMEPCPFCDGKGWTTCTGCNGTGVRE